MPPLAYPARMRKPRNLAVNEGRPFPRFRVRFGLPPLSLASVRSRLGGSTIHGCAVERRHRRPAGIAGDHGVALQNGGVIALKSHVRRTKRAPGLRAQLGVLLAGWVSA